jgi:hypothetical protein
MTIGNQTYCLKKIMCLDSVYFDWRFLTFPPDGGYVRNVIPSVSEESHILLFLFIIDS